MLDKATGCPGIPLHSGYAAGAPPATSVSTRWASPGSRSGMSPRKIATARVSCGSVRSPYVSDADNPSFQCLQRTRERRRSANGAKAAATSSARAPRTAVTLVTHDERAAVTDQWISGRPRKGASSFPPPNRLPAPAARTMAWHPVASGSDMRFARGSNDAACVTAAGVHYFGDDR